MREGVESGRVRAWEREGVGEKLKRGLKADELDTDCHDYGVADSDL